MAEHKPVTEEVIAIDCLYDECEHDLDAGDCPPTQMLVCQTCREEWEEGDLEMMVAWPCDFAAKPLISGPRS